MAISNDSQSDTCPVTDNILGELYRASKEGLPELIATVSPDLRATLALYCYRRSHLQGIGLVIASTCEEHDLVASGGIAGAALFARSREAAPRPLAVSHYAVRKTISLAKGPLRAHLPLADEPDASD